MYRDSLTYLLFLAGHPGERPAGAAAGQAAARGGSEGDARGARGREGGRRACGCRGRRRWCRARAGARQARPLTGATSFVASPSDINSFECISLGSAISTAACVAGLAGAYMILRACGPSLTCATTIWLCTTWQCTWYAGAAAVPGPGVAAAEGGRAAARRAGVWRRGGGLPEGCAGLAGHRPGYGHTVPICRLQPLPTAA